MSDNLTPAVCFDGFTNDWEQHKGSRAVPALRFTADDGSDFPEWEKKRLDKTGTFYGGLSGKSSSDFTNGNAQFLTYMNVYKNAFARQELTSSVKISEKESPNHVEYGDILFTQSSETVEEVGLSSVYLFKDRPYLNSFCMGFRPNSLSEIDPRYMGYCMRSEPVRRQIMVEGQGISRINIAASRLGTIKFFLPSLIEQTKIATVLSTVDSTIALCQRKLDLLTQAKKALMQQIFSQKLRFKADDGSDFPDWEEKKLGDIGTFIRGLSYDKTLVNDDGETLVLRSNNISESGSLDYQHDLQYVAKTPAQTQILQKNDIVVCMANGSTRLVGKSAQYAGTLQLQLLLALFVAFSDLRTVLPVCYFIRILIIVRSSPLWKAATEL